MKKTKRHSSLGQPKEQLEELSNPSAEGSKLVEQKLEGPSRSAPLGDEVRDLLLVELKRLHEEYAHLVALGERVAAKKCKASISEILRELKMLSKI